MFCTQTISNEWLALSFVLNALLFTIFVAFFSVLFLHCSQIQRIDEGQLSLFSIVFVWQIHTYIQCMLSNRLQLCDVCCGWGAFQACVIHLRHQTWISNIRRAMDTIRSKRITNSFNSYYWFSCIIQCILFSFFFLLDWILNEKYDNKNFSWDTGKCLRSKNFAACDKR